MASKTMSWLDNSAGGALVQDPEQKKPLPPPNRERSIWLLNIARKSKYGHKAITPPTVRDYDYFRDPNEEKWSRPPVEEPEYFPEMRAIREIGTAHHQSTIDGHMEGMPDYIGWQEYAASHAAEKIESDSSWERNTWPRDTKQARGVVTDPKKNPSDYAGVQKAAVDMGRIPWQDLDEYGYEGWDLAQEWQTDGIGARLSRIPESLRGPIRGLWLAQRHRVHSDRHLAAMNMAKEISQQNNATPDESRLLRAVMSMVDPSDMSVAQLQLQGEGNASAHVPLGSMLYLAHSDAKEPMKELRNAKEKLRLNPATVGTAAEGKVDPPEVESDDYGTKSWSVTIKKGKDGGSSVHIKGEDEEQPQEQLEQKITPAHLAHEWLKGAEDHKFALLMSALDEHNNLEEALHRISNLGEKSLNQVYSKAWVTIGGHAEGGEQHAGGTPVNIQGGKVVEGPKDLKGEQVGSGKVEPPKIENTDTRTEDLKKSFKIALKTYSSERLKYWAKQFHGLELSGTKKEMAKQIEEFLSGGATSKKADKPVVDHPIEYEEMNNNKEQSRIWHGLIKVPTEQMTYYEFRAMLLHPQGRAAELGDKLYDYLQRYKPGPYDNPEKQYKFMVAEAKKKGMKTASSRGLSEEVGDDK
jgi:hypothetical protein